MADSWAKIDVNDVPSLTAVTDDANQYITRLLVDPATGRLLVSALGAMGDVIGPASSVDGDIAIFDGITGKIIKDSGVQISGLQVALNGTGFVKAAGTVISYDNSTYVPTSRTVAGKALSADVTIALDDLSDVVITTPVVDQIFKYNGTNWINGTSTNVNGGSGVDFFLSDVPIISGPTVDSTVNTLSKTPNLTGPVTDSRSILAASSPLPIQCYLYNSVLGGTQIDAGVWDFDIWAMTSNATGSNLVLVNITQVKVQSGTVTMTGAGTTRTVTASGTPFIAGDASANQGNCSYIQTPGGIFPITAFISSSVVTITTPAGYSDESNVSFSIWYKLFQVQSSELAIVNSLSTVISTQPAFALGATDKLGAIYLGAVTSGTHTISYIHSNTTQYTHFNTPLVVRHNDLAGLQGGSATERYHLTAAQATIATQAANGSNAGYLTSADWTIFNNKQATLVSGTNIKTVGGNSLLGSGDIAVGTGTVTSVAALTLGTTGTDLSSSVATGTTTPVITLNVPTASASNRGALSNTDWSTFNNKANKDGSNWTFASQAIGDIHYASSTTAYTRLAAPAAGKILASGGVGAAPVYSIPTFPTSASATALKHIRSDGTNWIASTVTYPDASVTAGKVIISDGTNYIASTPTFPNASATTRKIIVSDGTNWTASTETYAIPGTSGNILTSDGTNWTSAAPAAATIPADVAVTATISLSSAQIKALATTPIQLAAAPGAGKVILLENVCFFYTYGGTAYTGTPNFRVHYSGDTNYMINYGLSVFDTPANFGRNFTAIADVTNTTLSNTALVTSFSGNPTVGNGTIKLYVKYRIITY